MRRKAAAAAVLLVIALAACGGDERKNLVPIRIGEREFFVEVASSPEQRSQGLMFRKELPENHGMLFVFQYDEHLSFWMKNTPLPLSIAFISSDGTIREIRDMKPLSEDPVRSRYAVRYALEVNRGAFERAGISPGDRVVLPEGLGKPATSGS